MSELAVEISKWSVANFGNTLVSHLKVFTQWNCRIEYGTVELNWMAPFLGIAEEISELHTALDSPPESDNYNENIADAIADIGIYFCDYLARRRTIYPFRTFPLLHEYQDLSIPYGQIAHCELKHAQKIRGMDDLKKFNDAHLLACMKFFETLNSLSTDLLDLQIEEVIQKTFEEIVSKRDWKKNADNGQ